MNDGAAEREPGEPERFNPFQVLADLDLGDLARMLQSPGPVNWEIARACAASLARSAPDGSPAPDETIDPARAAELLDLVAVAQTHVIGLTGLSEVGAIRARAVTKEEWTVVTLDGLRPVVEALSTTLAAGATPAAGFDPSRLDLARLVAGDDPAEVLAGDQEMFAGLIGALAPLLFGVQAGSLVGLLAQHALGQNDLPLPLAGSPQLAFALSNIERFANDWEIAPRDLAFSLAVREVVRSAPRSVPWVRERLVRLSSDFVSRYEMRAEVIEDKLDDLIPPDVDLAGFNPFDPSTELPMLDLDPVALLDGLRTAQQAPVLAELRRFGAVLEGYADVVVGELSASLAPDAKRVDEALRRHRVEHGRHTAFVEKMLGLALDRGDYEAGSSFCSGVVARAGLDGLNRLWEGEAMLPTAPELVAPGLWLARIDLDLSNP
jgi:putative hydrolase